MNRNGKLPDKRTVEMRVIGDWVDPGSRVLDLGCGRGVLLEYLVKSKGVRGVGVDYDFEKISACLRRGLTVYQGDLLQSMSEFPDGFFDRVVCSRTLEELSQPAAVIKEALRVGGCLTVGFVNHGFWKNRLATLIRGEKPRNDVYRNPWWESRPGNPVSVADFEAFGRALNLKILRRKWLRGNWRSSCNMMPNLFAGYAVYEVGRNS